MGFFVCVFWYALLYVLSSFAIILKGKRELVALILLSFGRLVCGGSVLVYVLVCYTLCPF